jgi:hypothetical protein
MEPGNGHCWVNSARLSELNKSENGNLVYNDVYKILTFLKITY